MSHPDNFDPCGLRQVVSAKIDFDNWMRDNGGNFKEARNLAFAAWQASRRRVYVFNEQAARAAFEQSYVDSGIDRSWIESQRTSDGYAGRATEVAWCMFCSAWKSALRSLADRP